MEKDTPAHRYWKENIKIVLSLLFIWALVSLGLATVWVDTLDQFQLAGFKLGFWVAHQGSTMLFVVLIWVYVFLMNRLDRRFDLDETEV